MSESYNNDIIFKTGPRIYYTIPVYNYNTYYDTVQYITIQFQYLILVQHNTLPQYVFLQSLYNSSNIVQQSLS